MLKKEIVTLLNEQVNKELFSAYLYLDIANYYAAENLNGFANWFTIQAQEERDHANLIMTYLLDNSEKVVLGEIKAPNGNFSDFKAPLKASLAHERYISDSINTIYGAAFDAREFKTVQFLDWFVKEQVEEEKNADELLTKYDLFATDGKGLYLLDSELAGRVYTAPVIAE